MYILVSTARKFDRLEYFLQALDDAISLEDIDSTQGRSLLQASGYGTGSGDVNVQIHWGATCLTQPEKQVRYFHFSLRHRFHMGKHMGKQLQCRKCWGKWEL